MSVHTVNKTIGFDPIEVVEIAARERNVIVTRDAPWRLTLQGATFEVVLWADGPMNLGVKAFAVLDLLAPVPGGEFT